MSYEAFEAKKEDLRDEVDQLEKDYEALEDKLTLGVSWASLNIRLETLTKASQEGFDLEAKITKANDAIKSIQQCQSFSTPIVESSKGDLSKDGLEADLADPQPSYSPQVDPSAPSEDAP